MYMYADSVLIVKNPNEDIGLIVTSLFFIVFRIEFVKSR